MASQPSQKTIAANWAIARARWEGDARCSYADVADLLGISKQAVGKRAIKDGWAKKLNLSHIAQRAHAAADRTLSREAPAPLATTLPAPALTDERLTPPESFPAAPPAVEVIPPAIPDSRHASPEMLAQAVEEAAVDARAQLLKRHRTEWIAARSQLYKALKSGDTEQARLAKLAGETLKLVQDGERKAWGLDTGEADGPVRIVIERQEGVRVVK